MHFMGINLKIGHMVKHLMQYLVFLPTISTHHSLFVDFSKYVIK
jgi:hypothetical protein